MRSLILPFLFFSNLCFSQTTYYVANNGVDANSRGGFSNPFKTISYAATKVIAGDTVKVRVGTYSNTNYQSSDIWKLEKTVLINNKQGTAAARITFMPYNHEKVVLKGDGDIVVQIRNSSYINFEGFEIEGEVERITLDSAFKYQFAYKIIGDPTVYYRVPFGTPPSVIATMTFPVLVNSFRPSLYSTMGLLVQGCHHVTIKKNLIHHLCGTGLRVFQSDYYHILENEVHNCSRRGAVGNHGLVVHSSTSIDNNTGTKAYISRNNVHHNYNEVYSWSEIKTFITPHIDEGKGISMQKNTYLNGWKNGVIQIDNNVTYYNGFSGVHINEGVRMDILNNTAYMNSYSGDGTNIGISVQDGDTVRVVNNITVADASFGGFALSTNSPTTLEFKNNFVQGLLDTDVTAIGQNTIFGDPLFKNPSLFDFSLLSTSSCINTALTGYLTAPDYLGYARDVSPDKGAIEYRPTDPTVGLFIEILPVNVRQIKWNVSQDINNDYFELRKSSDLISWKPVSCVESIGVNQYAFTDNQSTSGQNYYQIIQYDSQGGRIFSNIALINNCTTVTPCYYINVMKN